MTNLDAFFAFLGLCAFAALSGALFRAGAWYDALRKPSWQPPKWLFAPAWSILYLTIAFSGWLVWRKAGLSAARFPLAAWGFSLGINALWSPLFFGLRNPLLGMIDITALWLSIVAVIVLFHPVSPAASLLLLPYLFWVTFAGMLNLAILRLNPTGGTTSPSPRN